MQAHEFHILAAYCPANAGQNVAEMQNLQISGAGLWFHLPAAFGLMKSQANLVLWQHASHMFLQ